MTSPAMLLAVLARWRLASESLVGRAQSRGQQSSPLPLSRDQACGIWSDPSSSPGNDLISLSVTYSICKTRLLRVPALEGCEA